MVGRREFHTCKSGRFDEKSVVAGARWRIRVLTPAAVVLAIFAAWARQATAEQQSQAYSFQVARNDSANAKALANQLAALSPSVNREEANRLADCVYATVAQLRRQYRVFGTPIFQNFLVYWGVKQRGYCYQWTEDLLLTLDALKLTSLEFHWANSHAGNWRENNCLVVTARGQPFNRGIMLECWQHFGHLRWGPVTGDLEPYVENAAYARLVRARGAAKTSAINHQAAFQATAKAN